ncbi:hypothetical protein BG36_22485 [Aquamicrobium defluvii]|uniref:Uncharacterized protein n=1 Tax=Aquamicrobium defluvii TaxID=69279 RepID=A0A011TCY6_9HYPH|nr:hypothetical protein BG36_22485 [Aquamicrobium defluvii]EZQ12659.1 hypothetical protein CF98_34955 [Halopseudomonas bauzanensis]
MPIGKRSEKVEQRKETIVQPVIPQQFGQVALGFIASHAARLPVPKNRDDKCLVIRQIGKSERDKSMASIIPARQACRPFLTARSRIQSTIFQRMEDLVRGLALAYSEAIGFLG